MSHKQAIVFTALQSQLETRLFEKKRLVAAAALCPLKINQSFNPKLDKRLFELGGMDEIMIWPSAPLSQRGVTSSVMMIRFHLQKGGVTKKNYYPCVLPRKFPFPFCRTRPERLITTDKNCSPAAPAKPGLPLVSLETQALIFTTVFYAHHNDGGLLRSKVAVPVLTRGKYVVRCSWDTVLTDDK